MKKLLFISVFMCGCGDFYNEVSYESLAYDYLSVEERQALAPNDLFKSVLNRENINSLKQVLAKNDKAYLYSVNEDKDTPLGLALKRSNYLGAKYLISQMGPESLTYQNKNKESYVYLASKNGYPDLIKDMADKFYSYVTDYEFSDLDRENQVGNRALHIAKHEGVAEVLQAEYYRGLLEFPFLKFSYKTNKIGENFLHTAIIDDRVSVLAWGVEKNCATQADLDQYGFFYKTIYHIWNGLDNYSTSLTGIEFDNLMNEKNKNGDTPMHLAAKHLSISGVKALTNCTLIDYSLSNKNGDIPLQTFLKNLDSTLEYQDQEIKDAFVSIAESRSPYSLSTIKKYVNHTNKNGSSSLHIAAKTSDPFFYNYLKKYGSIVQKNNKGETPEYIFHALHKGVK